MVDVQLPEHFHFRKRFNTIVHVEVAMGFILLDVIQVTVVYAEAVRAILL